MACGFEFKGIFSVKAKGLSLYYFKSSPHPEVPRSQVLGLLFVEFRVSGVGFRVGPGI